MLTGTYALDGETLELKCDQASLQGGTMGHRRGCADAHLGR